MNTKIMLFLLLIIGLILVYSSETTPRNTAVIMFSLSDGTAIPQNQICHLSTSYPSGGGGDNNDCIILPGGSNERTFDLPNNGKQHVILYPNYYFKENYSDAYEHIVVNGEGGAIGGVMLYGNNSYLIAGGAGGSGGGHRAYTERRGHVKKH